MAVFESSKHQYTDQELIDAVRAISDHGEVENYYAAHYADGRLEFVVARDRVEAKKIAREYGRRIMQPPVSLISCSACQ